MTAVRPGGDLVLGSDAVVELAVGRLQPVEQVVIPAGDAQARRFKKGDWVLARGVLQARPAAPRNRLHSVDALRKGNAALVPFYPGAAGERVTVKGRISAIDRTDAHGVEVRLDGAYLTNHLSSRSIQFREVICPAGSAADDDAPIETLVGSDVTFKGVARFGLMQTGERARISDVDHPRFRGG